MTVIFRLLYFPVDLIYRLIFGVMLACYCILQSIDTDRTVKNTFAYLKKLDEVTG